MCRLVCRIVVFAADAVRCGILDVFVICLILVAIIVVIIIIVIIIIINIIDIVIICRVPIFGPVSGRAESSVRGGPKTAHMGRGLAGARNGPNRTIFNKEINKDLAPVRNRENRLPGPAGFWGGRFDVV